MALYMAGSTPVIRMSRKSGAFQGKKLETIVKSTVSGFFLRLKDKDFRYDKNDLYIIFCHEFCHDKIKK